MENPPESFAGFTAISPEAIDDYPIHRLMQIYLEKN
jgi:hypothetical protein